MFTEQIANMLARFIKAKTPTQQADALAQIGNCTQPVEHRGTMVIDKSPTNAPSQSISAGGINETNVNNFYATTRFSNWNSQYNTTTQQVEGGLTTIIDGGLYVDFIVGPTGTVIDTTQITTKDVLLSSPAPAINGDGDLVFKAARITVLKSEALSDVVLTTVAVDLLYDTDYSDSTHNFTQDAKPIRVFKAGAANDGTVVFTAEAC